MQSCLFPSLVTAHSLVPSTSKSTNYSLIQFCLLECFIFCQMTLFLIFDWYTSQMQFPPPSFPSLLLHLAFSRIYPAESNLKRPLYFLQLKLKTLRTRNTFWSGENKGRGGKTEGEKTGWINLLEAKVQEQLWFILSLGQFSTGQTKRLLVKNHNGLCSLGFLLPQFNHVLIGISISVMLLFLISFLKSNF